MVTKRPEVAPRKKIAPASNTGCLTGLLNVENKTRSLFLTLHNIKLLVDQWCQYMTGYIKSVRRESREYAWAYRYRKEFTEQACSSKGTETSNWQMISNETEKSSKQQRIPTL